MSKRKEPLSSIQAKTLRELVTDSVRAAILRGEYQPGEQLNQAHIAEKLGVSRGPVREALSLLEEGGLVRNVPYRAAYVNEFNAEHFDEVMSIRRSLEGYAVRRAIEYMQPDEIAMLRETVTKLEQAAEHFDGERALQLDLQFHSIIWAGARARLMMQIWKLLETSIQICLAQIHLIYDDPKDIIGSHPQILAAIEAGNVDEAARLLDQHIFTAGKNIRQHLAAVSNGDKVVPPNLDVNKSD